MRRLLLAGVIALAVAPITHATVLPTPSGQFGIVRVAEGCGNGWWRDPSGHCHPFQTPYGSNRGTVYGCPPGWSGTGCDKKSIA